MPGMIVGGGIGDDGALLQGLLHARRRAYFIGQIGVLAGGDPVDGEVIGGLEGEAADAQGDGIARVDKTVVDDEFYVRGATVGLDVEMRNAAFGDLDGDMLD